MWRVGVQVLLFPAMKPEEQAHQKAIASSSPETITTNAVSLSKPCSTPRAAPPFVVCSQLLCLILSTQQPHQCCRLLPELTHGACLEVFTWGEGGVCKFDVCLSTGMLVKKDIGLLATPGFGEEGGEGEGGAMSFYTNWHQAY